MYAANGARPRRSASRVWPARRNRGLDGAEADAGNTASAVTYAGAERLTVSRIGDEAIHLRDNSTDNVVSGNTVSDTGHRKPQYGEGIYVGTANSFWPSVDYRNSSHRRAAAGCGAVALIAWS